MQSSPVLGLHFSGKRVYQALTKLIVFNPAHSRHFDLGRKPKYDNGIVGIAFPLRQKFVGIGDRKRDRFVERKLPSFGVVLRSGDQ